MANQIRSRVVLPVSPGKRVRLGDWSFGTNKQQESGFIKNAYFNGVGRQVCQLQRLTIKFSKTGSVSLGVRSFIENDLMDFARANPGIALYLKPRPKTTPVLSAEYLNGTMHWFNLRLMSRLQVRQWIEYFVSRSGQQVQRFRKPIHTDHPSIQGHWTPFLNIPGRMNVTPLPDEERGAFVKPFLSASEQLIQMREQNADSLIIEDVKKDGKE